MCERGLPITWRANATFSATVLFGSSRKSWKTVPIWRRSAGHLPAGEPVELLAGDVDLARGGPRLAQHQPQEGRLAGAGGADEEDELALLDLDGDVVEGGAVLAGVRLGDVLESDHGGFSAGLGGQDEHADPRSSVMRHWRHPTNSGV